MTYQCPGCSGVFDTERGRTSHAAQNGDSQHPWDSYASVREAADYDGENRSTAEGSESKVPPNSGGDGGSGDPSLAAPEWGRDRAGLCDECGRRMTRLAEGQKVTVSVEGETKTGESEKGDCKCENCSTVRTNNGDVYELA